MISAIERASRWLAKRPPAIEGQRGSTQMFLAARAMVHRFELSAGDSLRLLHEYNSRCIPPFSTEELEHKVAQAFEHCSAQSETQASGPASAGRIRAQPKRRKWPKKQPARIIALLKTKPVTLEQMRRESPVKSLDRIEPVEVIDTLFRGGPDHGNSFICLAKDKYTAITKRRGDFTPEEINASQFFVCSPMSAATGKVMKKGNLVDSFRCLGNAPARPRFINLECDFSEADSEIDSVRRALGFNWLDVGATIACHLAQSVPIVAATSSASKSVHSLIAVQGQSETQILDYFRYACQYGADPAGHSKVALCRLPNGHRPGKGKQELLYFDHSPANLDWY